MNRPSSLISQSRPFGFRLVWVIWIPWRSLIAWMVFQAGGYSGVDILHLTENGVSVDEPFKYITYCIVIGIFVGLAATQFAGWRLL